MFLLEAIGAHLKPLGWDAGDIFVMSGYRTPYYNKQLDDTKFSLHQWGRASDIFLDKDDNGRMDDFNQDKVISKEDAVALAEVLEVLAKTPELRAFIGGMGIYGPDPGARPLCPRRYTPEACPLVSLVRLSDALHSEISSLRDLRFLEFSFRSVSSTLFRSVSSTPVSSSSRKRASSRR